MTSRRFGLWLSAGLAVVQMTPALAGPQLDVPAASATAGATLQSAAETTAARATKPPMAFPGTVQLTPQLLAAEAARPVPPRLPSSAFATLPALRAPVLSPDGLRYAGRMTIDGKEVLAIVGLTAAEKPRGYVIPEDAELLGYFWAGNGRLLYRMGKSVPWEDDRAFATRLAEVDLATGKQSFLGPTQDMGLKGDDVLWVDPEGRSLLLAYQPTVYDYPSVFSVDLANGKSTRVTGSFPNIWDWYADNNGVVRYGYGWTDSHHWQMVYRKTAADSFKIVARGTDKDDESTWDASDKAMIMAAGSEEGFILGKDSANGLNAIYRYNFATHQRGELVFEAPGSDVESAYTTEDGKDIKVAYFTDSRDRVKWWNPAIADLQQSLDRSVGAVMGEREVWIASSSRDDSIMLVDVLGPTDPGKWYVYQEATGRMVKLFDQNTQLKPSDLADTRYVVYPARDGTSIPAYLTLPVGRQARDLPLIVMPHGGPYGVRDRGDYDADVQFLANRGYAVLQPQYRGSGFYGDRFDKAGDAQWGRAMQDDIDDGMDWLTELGIADPKRVCLVGASYGGYAALWGATRNPERYRCAVSFAGVSDLPRQLKYQLSTFSDKGARERWRQKVQGDATYDLTTISPLYAVDRLKVPVMVVHGDKDTTVPPKQSRLYVDALKARGLPYEYYELAGEGHGFTTTANAQIWYDRLDAFLAKYNPVR